MFKYFTDMPSCISNRLDLMDTCRVAYWYVICSGVLWQYLMIICMKGLVSLQFAVDLKHNYEGKVNFNTNQNTRRLFQSVPPPRYYNVAT